MHLLGKWPSWDGKVNSLVRCRLSSHKIFRIPLLTIVPSPHKYEFSVRRVVRCHPFVNTNMLLVRPLAEWSKFANGTGVVNKVVEAIVSHSIHSRVREPFPASSLSTSSNKCSAIKPRIPNPLPTSANFPPRLLLRARPLKTHDGAPSTNLYGEEVKPEIIT
jgi:hypothetical protein